VFATKAGRTLLLLVYVGVVLLPPSFSPSPYLDLGFFFLLYIDGVLLRLRWSFSFRFAVVAVFLYCFRCRGRTALSSCWLLRRWVSLLPCVIRASRLSLGFPGRSLAYASPVASVGAARAAATVSPLFLCYALAVAASSLRSHISSPSYRHRVHYILH
jgi:hypothetical protein